MARVRNGAALKDIRTLFNVGMAAGLTDGQLLEQFATRPGEASELAFATLVERHGPMVLRACRGIVRDEHDAQDAFQATFLILVRRAGALWIRDSLGPWLHRVACRVATHARLGTGRRRAAERRAAEGARDCVGNPELDDRWRVIHEEIDRLSDRYRVPIILCDVEGRTYEEAARHLGCPIGTVKSRVARGRERLRERLTRRGLIPATGLVGVGLLTEPARATVPVALAENTSRAAVWIMTAKGTGGPFSATVAALAKGALRTMAMTQICKFGSMGLLLGVIAVGGGALIPDGSDQKAMANGVTDPSGTDDPKGDPDRIQGTWVRISTDGVKSVKTAKMVVKKATNQAEGDIPEGAIALVFEWKTEGEEGGSLNRVLLDPTRTQKTLDFFPEVKGGPKVCPGIYKLEGDTLTVCFRPVAGERPTEFVAGGKGGVLDIYKRAKS